MSANPSTSGTILGWTSKADNEEADMPLFSPFQSWESAASLPVTSSPPLPPPTPAQPSEPALSRPPMHRHSLSLTLPATTTTSTTMSANDPRRTRSSYPSPADRRARQKKEEDPDWVPRPLNSFMIFRVEYSRRHAQNNKEGDNPVPEKNLSRQASEAWRKLSDAEKRAYKLRADQMKIEHAKQNPGYRYRPRRRQSSAGHRPSGGLSRREQVVSFIERRAAGEYFGDSDADHSPEEHNSIASSSPEPPDVRARNSSPTRVVRRRRSYSLPLSRASAPDQCPSTRTYMLEPAPVSVISRQRARSSYTRPPSIYESTPELTSPYDIPNPYIDEAMFSYTTLDSSSASPSTPDLGIFDDLSFDDSFLSVSAGVSPQMTGSSLLSVATAPESNIPTIPESSVAPAPLFHRRQRSNTTSALPPSPLHMVSSSLANWNGAAAASTSSLPTFNYTASSPQYELSSYPVGRESMQDQSSSMMSSSSGSLSVASGELDLDRTPRVSEFPHDVQSTFMMQSTTTTMGLTQYSDYPSANPIYLSDNADLQAYVAGLDALNIAPESYGAQTDEIDYSELFHVSPEP